MSALLSDHLFGAASLQNESSFWELVNIDKSYQFELIDVPWWRSFMRSNWIWPFYASVAYLAAIFGIEKWMKSRQEFNLRTPLIIWNGLLGVFSILGFVRTAPVLWNDIISEKGPYQTLCFRDRTQAYMAYWIIMFAISKFFELGDTLFIVLRKRPIQLLQWYHHVATLIVVWITTPDAEPVGLCYVVMNYGVHSAMYPYFALKMAGVKIPRRISNAITTAQLVQMVAGFLLNVVTVGLIAAGRHCFRTPLSIWAFIAVYGSFVVLFGNLFKKAVLHTGRKGKEVKSD